MRHRGEQLSVPWLGDASHRGTSGNGGHRGGTCDTGVTLTTVFAQVTGVATATEVPPVTGVPLVPYCISSASKEPVPHTYR